MKYKISRLIAFVLVFQMLVIYSQGYHVYADYRNDNKIDKIDKYLNECMDILDVPGMSVVVVKDEKILFSKGYGIESIETNKPMTKDSSSGIGSLTKSFTALAMMQLVEQGKVSLEDPIIIYIPWFKTLDEEDSSKITIKMLLSHTSGLPRDAAFDKIFMSQEKSNKAREAYIRSLSAYSLVEEPGKAYQYSNTGFIVAGYIIEQVTGMTYEDYIQENILKPLEMKSSTTKLEDFDKIDVLYGHLPGINTAIDSNKISNIIGTPAGSEFRCSVSDLGNYLIMLMNDGRYKNKAIVSKESINKLFEPVIHYKEPSQWGKGEEWDMSYALGFSRGDIEGVDIINHGGQTRGMSSMNMIDKKSKIGVQLLFNVSNINTEKYEMSELFIVQNIMGILKGKEPILKNNKYKSDKSSFKLSDESKEQYIGNYTNSSGNLKIIIKKDNKNELFAELYESYGKWQFEIEFLSPSRVKMTNIAGSMISEFMITSEGKVTGCSIQPFGKMIKISEDIYKGYIKHLSHNEKYSFLLPEDYKVNWDKEDFTVTDKNNSILVKGEYEIDTDKFNKEKVKEYKKRGIVLFESDEYRENISSYVCTENVLTLEEGTDIKQFIVISIQGMYNIGITAEVPYGSATAVIRDVILQIIDTLE